MSHGKLERSMIWNISRITETETRSLYQDGYQVLVTKAMTEQVFQVKFTVNVMRIGDILRLYPKVMFMQMLYRC